MMIMMMIMMMMMMMMMMMNTKIQYIEWNSLSPRVVAVDNVASIVQSVNSLSTHFSVLDLDRHSYCEFVTMFIFCRGRL